MTSRVLWLGRRIVPGDSIQQPRTEPSISDLSRTRVRRDQRHRLPSVAAVHPEVPINTDHYTFGFDLRHANQASVSQRHGHVPVTAHEGQDGLQLLVESKIELHRSTLDQFENRFRAI